MDKVQRSEKLNKFFLDPDWHLVEQMVYEYIEPLRDISTIDLNRGSDAVMADVAGRQKAYDGMVKFLKDCRILGKAPKITSNSFK